MNRIVNRAQIPLRWLIHGIFFQRVYQMLFPRQVEKKFNEQAEREFEQLSENQLNKDPRKEKIIVSLAAIPARLGKIHLVISRLMNQTIRPDKIIVYLDEDKKEEFIFTDELEKLITLGLECKFVYDIGPHKKYFYALQEFSNDIVITVDDDTIYSHQLIETLMNSYRKFPKAISANIVTNFFFRGGKLAPSLLWRQKFTYGVGNEYSIAYGVGGVLYPPKVMPDETFDEERIRELSLFADDLWLKAIENKNGIDVVKAKGGDKLYSYFVTVAGSQKVSLWNTNDLKDRNVEYLSKLFSIFWSNSITRK